MRAREDIQMRLHKALGRKDLFLRYSEDRLEQLDYHGVADAAMDLREIQQEIDVLEWVLTTK